MRFLCPASLRLGVQYRGTGVYSKHNRLWLYPELLSAFIRCVSETIVVL